MSQSEKISILWVEDAPRQVFQLIKDLEGLGFSISMSTSATEGLYQIGLKQYDVIVADLLMPPPDGIDFLEKAYELQPSSVFIVYTAFPYNNLYRQRISDLDFDVEVLQKPLELAMFTLSLFQVLSNRWPRLETNTKTLWRRIIDALEIKPGLGGVALDVKELFGL